jgi:uncharacterized membrane protein YkoI
MTEGPLSGRIARALAVLVLVGAGLTPVLAAAGEDDQDVVRQLRQQGEILPLSSIIERLTAQHPGRVLEVELEDEGGRRIYEIEILERGGELHKYHVDAHTGKILSRDKE